MASVVVVAVVPADEATGVDSSAPTVTTAATTPALGKFARIVLTCCANVSQ